MKSFFRYIWLEFLTHTHMSNELGQLAFIDDRYRLISIRIGSHPTHLCNTNLCPVLIQVRTIAMRIMFHCNACFLGIKNTYSTAPETFFCSHLWKLPLGHPWKLPLDHRQKRKHCFPVFVVSPVHFCSFILLFFSFVNINTK